MRRFFTLLIFIALAFFISYKPSYAATPFDQCITNRGTTGNCNNFMGSVANCFVNGEATIPKEAWNHATNDDNLFECRDFDGNGFVDDADLTRCQTNFSTFVCNTADPQWGEAGSCSSGCSYMYFGGTYQNLPISDVLGREFRRYARDSGTGTPTPTPTRAPTPTGSQRTIEYCLSQIYFADYTQPNACRTNLDLVASCLQQVPLGDITSKYGDNYQLLEQDVRDAFDADPDTRACLTNEFEDSMPEVLGELFTTVQQTETQVQNGGVASSSDAIEGNLSLDQLTENTETPTNCGRLQEGINACCEHPTSPDIDENANLNLKIPSNGQDETVGPVVRSLQSTWEAISWPFRAIYGTLTGAIKRSTEDYIGEGSQYYCFEGGMYKELNEADGTVKSCTCVNSSTALVEMCGNINSENTSEITACENCVTGSGFWTAFGCIDSNFQDFIQNTVFGWGLGLAGVSALLCVIYASFRMQLAANNAEQIKESQDLLTSCITGLIIIIFSVVILRIIGVDILRLPFLQ